MRRKKSRLRRRIFTVVLLFVLGFFGSNVLVNDIAVMTNPADSHVLAAAENTDPKTARDEEPWEEPGTEKEKSPEEKICYLTFDDGPSLNTETVLNILSKEKVKATFFVTGSNPDCDYLIKRAYNEGHTIGLHTYSHNYYDVYDSEQSYFNDLEKVSNRVYRLTGYRSNIIRFPGGSSNTVSKFNPGIMTSLTAEAVNVGYYYFDWNVSSGDAVSGGLSKERIVDEIKRGIMGKTEICVLMHDSGDKASTAEALPEIIDAIRNAGYSFEKLTPASYGFQHTVNN